jgi:YfiH family protein
MQSVLRASSLTAHGFLHGSSTRHGPAGVSGPPFATLNLGSLGAETLAVRDDPANLLENQRRFAAAVGYRPERLFTVSQVHGRTARILGAHEQSDPQRVRSDRADALVCAANPQGGALAIGIRTADCVPILLADPETRAVAAVHGGWRGLVAGVLSESVRGLCEVSGAAAERLIAVIFPHIGGCCFEVGEEVALQLQAAGPAVVLREASRPKPHVVLERVAHAQLLAAGVSAARIEHVPGCTSCDADRFFSYRRDGQASGRHMTVIVAG